MKKIFCILFISFALVACDKTETKTSKVPDCDSSEVIEILSEDRISIDNVTQRPSRISDKVNVCSAEAFLRDIYFLSNGVALRAGFYTMDYTVQKTTDGKTKVRIYGFDFYRIGTMQD